MYLVTAAAVQYAPTIHEGTDNDRYLAGPLNVVLLQDNRRIPAMSIVRLPVALRAARSSFCTPMRGRI
jgi:hypothetical protein